MTTVKAILTKPLDGQPEGTEREFDKLDFDRLEALGAVRSAGDEKVAPSLQNKMDTRPLKHGPGIEIDNKSGSTGDISRAAKPKG